MAGSFVNVLSEPAWEVAPRLLGCLMIREVGGEKLVGRIVETEAYDQTDAASHSYRGRTPRTDVMFGPPGRSYVYFTYGMHYCFNVVTGPKGHGSAVLIRALEPLQGVEFMRHNRNKQDVLQLTNGPAKLCQALAIDRALNAHDLARPPLQIEITAQIPNHDVVQSTRIGITKEVDKPWRFYIRDNQFISKR